MKMKTLGMLTMSGLLTAAFAYGVPALAEDTSTTGADALAMQPAPDAAQTQNMGSANDMGSNAGGTSGSATDSSSTSNEGTADMPSGDDDY